MADQPEYYNISEGDIVYKERSPKVVNGYLMGDIVGKGSYAKVKEAIIVKEHTDFEFGAHVAIKITHQRQLRKIPGGQEAVEREIKFLKKLHHQNIVRFVEFFQQEEKGKIYLVLEYVNGGTLQELIDRAGRPLSMAQARMYFRHILSGLDYIHKQGFVHRGICPSGIILLPSHQASLELCACVRACLCVSLRVCAFADITSHSLSLSSGPADQSSSV